MAPTHQDVPDHERQRQGFGQPEPEHYQVPTRIVTTGLGLAGGAGLRMSGIVSGSPKRSADRPMRVREIAGTLLHPRRSSD
jgi:hypothetical protein